MASKEIFGHETLLNATKNRIDNGLRMSNKYCITVYYVYFYECRHTRNSVQSCSTNVQHKRNWKHEECLLVVQYILKIITVKYVFIARIACASSFSTSPYNTTLLLFIKYALMFSMRCME